MEKYSKYGTGYDPKAIEHDLRLISELMHGKKELTVPLSQEIYYKIKARNIKFQSSKGEEFLDKLLKNMTESQRKQIEGRILAKKRRKRNTKRFLNLNRKIAVVIFLTVLLLCIVFLNWNLLLDIRTNYQAKKLRDKIKITTVSLNESRPPNESDTGNEEKKENRQEAAGTVINNKEEIQAKNSDTPVILNKFTALHEENPDFAGWLSIEGTKINYPVMSREGDNNYYLNKNFTGQEDKNGLLILDYRSDVLERGHNAIIYGHNIRTGVMFGTLKNYKDKDFCMEHQTIRFDSLYEEGEYKVVAAMLSAVAYEDEDVFRYYDAVDISTEESFDAFRQNMILNALYTTDESLEYGDSCLILSTCDYYTEDGRFVVIAKKINEGED